MAQSLKPRLIMKMVGIFLSYIKSHCISVAKIMHTKSNELMQLEKSVILRKYEHDKLSENKVCALATALAPLRFIIPSQNTAMVQRRPLSSRLEYPYQNFLG